MGTVNETIKRLTDIYEFKGIKSEVFKIEIQELAYNAIKDFIKTNNLPEFEDEQIYKTTHK